MVPISQLHMHQPKHLNKLKHKQKHPPGPPRIKKKEKQTTS